MREEQADFFIEIGEYHKAIKCLNEAISIFSSNFKESEVKRVY